MVNGVTVKVCGITSPEDAALAAGAGADYLGFIFHPKSPRYVTAERFASFSPRLPKTSRVAVLVDPAPDELRTISGLGFDRFQIHFPESRSVAEVKAWSDAVGAGRLWLAPRLAPGTSPGAEIAALGSGVLVDTYHPEKFGGTGETGDWDRFRELQKSNSGKTWILSGGLTPANISRALQVTGARFVDVNSGVETSPGRKDRVKLQQFVTTINQSHH